MISVTIEELANSYKVRFSYNTQAVERIKTIPGRQFRKDMGNAWLVPKTSQRALERFIAWASGKEALKTIQRKAIDPETAYPTCTKGDPLWKHQLEAYRFLVNRTAALLDLSMGSGKSRVLVDYVHNTPEMRRVLILCPRSFVQGWRGQFEKHGGRPVVMACLDDSAGTVLSRVQLGRRALADAASRNLVGVVVVNYDVIWRESKEIKVTKIPDCSSGGFYFEVRVPDSPYFVKLFGAYPSATWDAHSRVWYIPTELSSVLKEAQHWWTTQTSKDGPEYAMADWLLDTPWDVVAADEIQRVRNSGTAISKSAYRLGAAAPVRIGLSGTPFPESPMDSFGVCRFLDASLFGTSFVRYRAHYAVMGGFEGRQVIGYINQKEIKAKIATLRFTMEPEGYELPDAQDITVPLVLPEKVQKLYRQLERDLYAKVGTGEVTLANSAVAFGRLQQLTGGVLPVDNAEGVREIQRIHNTKADALQDILESLPPRNSVVVIARFREDLKRIHEVAEACNRLSGEVSGLSSKPEARIDKGVWVGPETVLAVQAQSGVEGLDFTRAHVQVFYSYALELGKYDQAVARIRRAGQTEKCLYYHLLCTGTVDEKIQKLLEKKQHVLQGLLGEGGASLRM